MKQFLIVLVLLCSTGLTAQKAMDTIYANDKKNVALFFPSPIRQGIVGAAHFTFTYNREQEQYFGLLQAKPGLETNLLTITNDGQVYSYILKYAVDLPKLNYFIETSESIGNEKPFKKVSKPLVVVNNSFENRITHFQKFSTYLLKAGSERLAVARKKGMKLRLQKMTYNASEVYLAFELVNSSGIDFEIEALDVFRVSGNKKRKASFQRLAQQVIYKHTMPEVIQDKQVVRFVYVLPKFVLGTNEFVQLELKERNGHRSLRLNYKR